MTANPDPKPSAKALTRPELIRRVAEKTGKSLVDTTQTIRCLEETIVEALAQLEAVRLQGIGTLRPVWRAGAVIRSPHDRKRMFLDGRWSIGFRLSQTAKRAMGAQTPGHYRDDLHQRAWRLAETLIADLVAYHPDARPAGIVHHSRDADVRRACEDAFPGNWARATKTWATQTPEKIQAERDHLAEAARIRWANR